MRSFPEEEVCQLTPCSKQIKVATEDTVEPKEAMEVKVAEDTTTKMELNPKEGPNVKIVATTMS